MSDHYRSEGAHLAEGEDQFREEGTPSGGKKGVNPLGPA